jgi:two-component system, OmpR family, response regulator
MPDLAPMSPGVPTSLERSARILLVEDDIEIARLLGKTFAENGFSFHFAKSATEMDIQLQQRDTDLVILDVMLPGESGISICRRLRNSSDVPIIMLTALGEDIDRILGLELGADDYVTKPFNSRELIARIRSLLRRAGKHGARGQARRRVFHFAGWRLNATERQLYSADGVRVTTTSAELDLLVALCEHPGRILSRDRLLDLTHSGLAGPVERSIDVHISRIRQKIESNPRDPKLIKTVRLGGYLFTPSVDVR